MVVLALTQAGASRERGRRLAWLGLPVAVVAAYLGYLYAITGSWTAWLDAQTSGWARGFAWPWQSLQHTLNVLAPGAYADHPEWRVGVRGRDRLDGRRAAGHHRPAGAAALGRGDLGGAATGRVRDVLLVHEREPGSAAVVPAVDSGRPPRGKAAAVRPRGGSCWSACWRWSHWPSRRSGRGCSSPDAGRAETHHRAGARRGHVSGIPPRPLMPDETSRSRVGGDRYARLGTCTSRRHTTRHADCGTAPSPQASRSRRRRPARSESTATRGATTSRSARWDLTCSTLLPDFKNTTGQVIRQVVQWALDVWEVVERRGSSAEWERVDRPDLDEQRPGWLPS